MLNYMTGTIIIHRFFVFDAGTINLTGLIALTLFKTQKLQ